MSTTIDPSTGSGQRLSELAVQAGRELEGASAHEILTWAHEEFGSGLVVTSSLADTVMISLAEKVAPGPFDVGPRQESRKSNRVRRKPHRYGFP